MPEDIPHPTQQPTPTVRVQTGLQKLRTIAPASTLVDSLVPETAATFESISHAGNVHPNRQVSLAEQNQMFREWSAGANLTEVEDRYGVSRGYIRQAMLRRFGSKEKMLEALQNLILENAVGANMVAQQKLNELTGPQAVLAGKMLTESFVLLDKHVQTRPKKLDFAQLKGVTSALKEIRSVITGETVCNVANSEPQP